MPPLLALASLASASAAITYVDATTLNTSGQASFPTGGNIYNDNLWSVRTVGSANSDVVGNTVFEAGPEGGAENVPTLTTLITGLTPGATYDLYVYFVTFPTTDANQLWRLRAGLDPGALTAYDRDSLSSVVLTDGSTTTLADPAGNPVTVPAARDYRQASLGTAIADGSGTISVYVDSGLGTNDANHRSWFDGVGYQAVPEPSAALLGALGASALLRRRRCRR